jgi:hypothetical protein
MFWLLAFLQIRKRKSGRQGTDLTKIKQANGFKSAKLR